MQVDFITQVKCRIRIRNAKCCEYDHTKSTPVCMFRRQPKDQQRKESEKDGRHGEDVRRKHYLSLQEHSVHHNGSHFMRI